MEVLERARRYVGCMEAAVSGSGGHVSTFKVAIALRHGFGLGLTQAWPLMLEYNQRCVPPWSFKELEHKLREAEKVAHQEPRGHLLGTMIAKDGKVWNEGENAEHRTSNVEHRSEERNWREYDPVALQGEQRTDIKIGAQWLWKRSPVDTRSMPAGVFLTHVCGAGDRILVFNNERSQGQFIFWNHEVDGKRGWYRLSDRRGVCAKFAGSAETTPPEIMRARMGVWWLCQPVTGEWKSNGQKWSRRSEGNVAAWRTMVIESDEEGIEPAWLNLLVQLPLKITALYTSGSRSVHALVRVDMPSKAAWDQLRDYFKPALTRLGADKGVFSAVRLTRLPGCFRQGKNGKDGRYVRFPEARMQRLLYLNPNAEARPILDLPVLRNQPMWEEAYA